MRVTPAAREFPYPSLHVIGAEPVQVGRVQVGRLQALSHPRELLQYSSELEHLRLRSRHAESSLPMHTWLMTRSVQERTCLRTYLLRRDGRIAAAIFLHERVVYGLPTGYFYGGDGMGEDHLICDAKHEQELRSEILQLLLRSHRAFLIRLDELPSRPAEAPKSIPGIRSQSTPHSLYWKHPLRPTFDQTLAGLGRRTRRNLRYALRRVESQRWEFLPELSAGERTAAIDHLALHSTHRFSPELAKARLQVASETPGSFAMGLRDEHGAWLSCILGRRINGSAQVFWQPNASGHGADSLCTTMRALFMQEEIRRNRPLDEAEQTRHVSYIGGTCPLMQHCCSPTPAVHTAFARPGLRLRLLQALFRTPLAPPNSPLHDHF